MQAIDGYVCVRFGDVPWERRDEDQWPPLVKRLHRDEIHELGIRIIWYGRGVTEPRHIHNGTHATWVLVGSATIDEQTFGPGDLVYGPGGVAHGPLLYEMGCVLFATLHGGAFHTEVRGDVEKVSHDGLAAHIALEQDRSWEPLPGVEGAAQKVMVEDAARDYTARLTRWPAGSELPRHRHEGSHAGIITKGQAIVGGETFGPWDTIYGPGGQAHGPIRFPEECIMIVNSLGDIPPCKAAPEVPPPSSSQTREKVIPDGG